MPIGKLFGRLRDGLAKTRANIGDTLREVTQREVIGEEELEALEEALLRADVSMSTTEKLLEAVRKGGSGPDADPRARLAARVVEILRGAEAEVAEPEAPPLVALVVGVNGTGKTTTVGKLAARHAAEGRRVLLVAGDTFRAAANEQLALWAERAGVEIVESRSGADPASVAFDGVSAGRSRGVDLVLVDTAGRLHAKTGLMSEVEKIHRVIGKAQAGAPHETLLVLDATIGQNAIQQAREFGRSCPVTGLVLTKLDGTARGGVIVSIVDELGLPVRYVGVGEGLEDLLPFDAEAFADALLG